MRQLITLYLLTVGISTVLGQIRPFSQVFQENESLVQLNSEAQRVFNSPYHILQTSINGHLSNWEANVLNESTVQPEWSKSSTSLLIKRRLHKKLVLIAGGGFNKLTSAEYRLSDYHINMGFTVNNKTWEVYSEFKIPFQENQDWNTMSWLSAVKIKVAPQLNAFFQFQYRGDLGLQVSIRSEYILNESWTFSLEVREPMQFMSQFVYRLNPNFCLGVGSGYNLVLGPSPTLSLDYQIARPKP